MTGNIPKTFDVTAIAIIIFLLMLIFFSSCKHEPVVPPKVTNDASTGNNGGSGPGYTENTCDPDTTYFVNDILPLFISNCAKSGCHDAASHQEGIILDSYTNIMNTGRIQPGNPSAGKIVDAITATDPDDVMPRPPANRLTTNQINSIITWINQGALNNSCSGRCDTVLVTYSGTVVQLLQSRCTGCHNNQTPSGTINLSNYNGVQAVAVNGKLMGAIDHAAGYSPMPKGGAKMPACEIEEIRIWVNGGAPNN
jgi:hypothetical protein